MCDVNFLKFWSLNFNACFIIETIEKHPVCPWLTQLLVQARRLDFNCVCGLTKEVNNYTMCPTTLACASARGVYDSLCPTGPPREAQACPSGGAGSGETGRPSPSAPRCSSGRAESSGPGSSPQSLWNPGSALSCRSMHKTHTAREMGHFC